MFTHLVNYTFRIMFRFSGNLGALDLLGVHKPGPRVRSQDGLDNEDFSVVFRVKILDEYGVISQNPLLDKRHVLKSNIRKEFLTDKL